MIIALVVFAGLVIGAYFFGKAVGSGAFGATKTLQDFLKYLERP